jgi:alpha-galactosidase
MRKAKGFSRRQFLKGGALVSAAALTIAPRRMLTPPSVQGERQTSAVGLSTFFDLLRRPDFVTAFENSTAITLRETNGIWTANGITVNTDTHAASAEMRSPHLSIALSSSERPLSRLHLRWQMRVAPGLRFLGDHWERGYGDLEWRSLVGEGVMPWYFLVYDSMKTHGYGVQTAPKAMAFWAS